MSSNGLFWIKDPSFGANTVVFFCLIASLDASGACYCFYLHNYVLLFWCTNLIKLCFCILYGVPDTLVRKYTLLTLRLEKY